MSHGTPHRRGFTLIELLVVIAIIAILAAILFPVFAQARESARKTSCLSNVRQMGTAAMMYAQDYDESYPGLYQWSPGAIHIFWTYLYPGSAQITTTQAIQLCQTCPYVKNADIFRCPSHKAAYPPAPGAGNPQLAYSYGYAYPTMWGTYDLLSNG